MFEIRTNIIGTWKLIACDMEYQDSGVRELYFKGRPASSYAVFTPEGRMVVLLVGGDHEPRTKRRKTGSTVPHDDCLHGTLLLQGRPVHNRSGRIVE
jgi:hypothetical protein